MTMPSFEVVARALGHSFFTLRGDGRITMDDPAASPPTEVEIAAAQAAINAEAQSSTARSAPATGGPCREPAAPRRAELVVRGVGSP